MSALQNLNTLLDLSPTHATHLNQPNADDPAEFFGSFSDLDPEFPGNLRKS